MPVAVLLSVVLTSPSLTFCLYLHLVSSESIVLCAPEHIVVREILVLAVPIKITSYCPPPRAVATVRKQLREAQNEPSRDRAVMDKNPPGAGESRRGNFVPRRALLETSKWNNHKQTHFLMEWDKGIVHLKFINTAYQITMFSHSDKAKESESAAYLG